MKQEWLKEILGDGYTEEADEKVSEKLGEIFIFKADFDAQIEAKDKELLALKENSGGKEELQKRYDELQGKYKTETDSLNKEIRDSQKNTAVDMAIFKAKGKNAKAIKALLDMEKINIKEDGTLEGLDLESLKKTDGYLFDVETKQGVGTGFTKGAVSKGTDVNAQIAKAMGIKTN